MKESKKKSFKNLHNLFDLNLSAPSLTEIPVDTKRL